MPADCEVNGCGVLAIGRCVECGQAMCASHRARGEGGPITNLCSECERKRTQRWLEELQGVRESDDPRVRREMRAQEQIKRVAHRLAEAGFGPDSRANEGRRLSQGVARRLLGRAREVRDPDSDRYGWYVGEYGWEVPDSTGVRSWAIKRTFVNEDGLLMMEGGHTWGENGYYIPFKPAPYKNRADSFNGEYELWEEIASKMVDLARQRGLEII